MFGGGISYEQPISTGKRISGLQSRKQPSLTLGWDNSDQLNSYQVKKRNNKQITGKITSANQNRSYGYSSASNRKQPVYDEAAERMKMRQLYQQLSMENPDIHPEELEKYMMDYENERRHTLQQQQQQYSKPPQPPQQQMYERRAPIKQKESMRDIIYNGVGVGQTSMEQKRAASRRNNSNLVLGDGYNYFQEGSRK